MAIMQEEGPGYLFASSPRARSPEKVRGLILYLSTTGLSTRYSYNIGRERLIMSSLRLYLFISDWLNTKDIHKRNGH